MLPNKQEKPHAPRQIDHQGNRIPRRPQQINHRPKHRANLLFQIESSPLRLHRYRIVMVIFFINAVIIITAGVIIGGVACGRQSIRLFLSFVEIYRRAPDKGCRETPCDSDQDEGEDVVEGGGGRFGSRCVWVHGEGTIMFLWSIVQEVSSFERESVG